MPPMLRAMVSTSAILILPFEILEIFNSVSNDLLISSTLFITCRDSANPYKFFTRSLFEPVSLPVARKM
ncbi:hypothetical protein J517_1301 [Acinetobacter baumannii 118362]|nr:hypothetical protein J517_1301 [Acinetobacter baumannii 118362]